MTPSSISRWRCAAAALTVVGAAGFGAAALAAGDPAAPPASPPRMAVVATVATPAAELARAVAAARAASGDPGGAVAVRRTGGALEAQALVLTLAADGVDVVAGVGDAGRAAVGQALSAGAGDGTRWVAIR